MSARFRLVLACLLLALSTGGCGLRFAYTQLDWLLPWYLRDYVTLDAGQRTAFDTRLAAKLDWHCRIHLPEYATWLRRAEAQLGAGPVSVRDLERYAGQAERFWNELMVEIAPDARSMLAGLSDDQVAELAGRLEERMRESRAEFLEGSARTLREKRIDRMEDRLQRWFGRLTPEQRQLVADWSDAIAPSTARWLDNRARWQGQLVDALRRRGEPEAFGARIDELLMAPQRSWSPEYRRQVERNRARTLALLVDLHRSATPAQRARVVAEVGDLAVQFEQLACAGPGAVATATH